MNLADKYTLGSVGDKQLTIEDVAEWSDDVFAYAGNVLNQQPDPFGMGVWSHLHFGSMSLPDTVSEVDIRPLKNLVRAICAFYQPGSNYGPQPTADDFLRIGAEARESHWRLSRAIAALEDSIDERLVTANQVSDFLGIKRTSLSTKTWPSPAVKGAGQKPSQYRWSDLKSALQLQYPKENWDGF